MVAGAREQNRFRANRARFQESIMEFETLLGMAMLGRAVVEILALGFGLGLLAFGLRRLAEVPQLLAADFERTVRLGQMLLTVRWQERRSTIALCNDAL
jgi:hypothetical protein